MSITLGSDPVDDASALRSVRTVLRGLILPGQRRLHMKDENDSRKFAIAAAIVTSGVRIIVYDAARDGSERERRAACLTALIEDIARRGDDVLVIEQDDTLIASDRQLLHRAARVHGVPE